MSKRTAIDKAIEALEREGAVINLAIQKLKAQQSVKPTPRKVNLAESRPTLIVNPPSDFAIAQIRSFMDIPK